jgi:hypothetical protein
LGGIAQTIPPIFCTVMRFKYLILGCLLLIAGACLASDNAPVGFLEGRLRILANKEVELAEGNPPKFSGANYTEYPLIILSQDGKKEITRVIADENGKFRVALPPGDYLLDVQGRLPKGHVRAKPQRFTVVSNQTVRIDMDIDTGIR